MKKETNTFIGRVIVIGNSLGVTIPQGKKNLRVGDTIAVKYIKTNLEEVFGAKVYLGNMQKAVSV